MAFQGDKNESSYIPGFHQYQPPRHPKHNQFSHVSTDPMGEDWTAVVNAECYRVLADLGVFALATFDAYATVRHSVSEIDPNTGAEINRNLGNNGIGDSFIHAILPDLPHDDVQLLIRAGKIQFTRDSGGVAPLFFWAPESALSTLVLEEIAAAGYKGLMLAPHQVRQDEAGVASDNRPTKLTLPSGRVLQAIPFDKQASHAFAFEPKHNANNFVVDQLLPAFMRVVDGLPLVTFTDAETFGHHWKGGAEFLHYLLTIALPNRGTSIISINQLEQIWDRVGFNIHDGHHNGHLVERSAWSCHCGDLRRWNDICACGPNSEWKKPFYQLCKDMNGWIKQVAYSQLPNEHRHWLEENFSDALNNPGGIYSNVTMSILSAESSMLAALTSCATFFEDPHTSGRINVLFMLQGIEHLRDAGLTIIADEMRRELEKRLQQIPDKAEPHTNLWQTMSQMLDGKMVPA